MNPPVILITDKGKGIFQEFKAELQKNSFDIIDTTTKISPIALIKRKKPDLILLGVTNGNFENEMDTVKQIRKRDTRTPVICIAKRSSEALVIAALKAGVDDFFKMPFSTVALLESINEKLFRQPVQAKTMDVVKGYRENKAHTMIVGQSKGMNEVKQQLLNVALSDCAVLITGETGTGKELAARTIHHHSDKKNKRLVCINCAAIPDSLVESELFGYERGAFTGAFASKQGLFESASDGSVFLDEIGDMTPFAQAKILRTIELKETCRLGSKKGRSLNFRVISATNRDPEKLITEKQFRRDLYYRLNVARIHLPPLRDRKEDLPALIDHYIEWFNKKFGRKIKSFSQEAMHALVRYDWPGNVRELVNLIEISFINLPCQNIDFLEVPQQLRIRFNQINALPTSERDRVIAALCATNWNKSKAAQKLNWSRMTLYRKIAKYSIDSNPTHHLETAEA